MVNSEDQKNESSISNSEKNEYEDEDLSQDDGLTQDIASILNNKNQTDETPLQTHRATKTISQSSSGNLFVKKTILIPSIIEYPN